MTGSERDVLSVTVMKLKVVFKLCVCVSTKIIISDSLDLGGHVAGPHKALPSLLCLEDGRIYDRV